MTTWRVWIVLALAGPMILWPWAKTWAADLGPARHKARVILNPENGSIDVVNTITLDATGRVTLRLRTMFVVDSISVDGARRSPERHDEKLIVDVGSPGTHTIQLHVRANLATATPLEQPPFLRADGGFLARGWLGHPVDRLATYAIEAVTTAPNTVVLPGKLSKEKQMGETYTATFSSDIPDNPPVLITGPFVVAEKISGDVRIRTYFHKELAPLSGGYLEDAARYIEHYANKIGPFPYAGFAMVSGPLPVGLGLPGMTYMGRKVLALPFIRTTSLPHEVLHNWWGNSVRVDYDNGNWAEGLTTYQADHAQAAGQAQDGGREKRLEWLRNYAALPAERDQPATAFQAKTHDASQVVGYDKVAFFFHMLKARLGDDVFDKAMHRFYADNRNRVAGWGQIRKAFEAESGENLEDFFYAWLKRPGAPELALQNVSVEGRRVTFDLAQSQKGAPYPLVTHATVNTQTGEQDVRLVMDKKSHRYSVVVDAPPTSLSIDPSYDVFRRLSADETPPILRDVTLDSSARLLAPGNVAQAKTLAEELMQSPVSEIETPAVGDHTGALIIVGLTPNVLAALSGHGLPSPPAGLAAADARAVAYVARDNHGRRILVAMAETIDALEELARVLPHYKRRSFVVMGEDGVSDKGTWPSPPGPLLIKFE